MDDNIVPFLLDSFSPSDYVTSTAASQSTHLAEQNVGFPQECDFLTLITGISTAYSCGLYMPMTALNDMRWDNIGGGRHFQVSRPSPPSSTEQNHTQNDYLDNNNHLDNGHRDTDPHRAFVVKRVQSAKTGAAMQPKDMALFVRELSIMHHLRNHDSIVQLLGVGWFNDNLDNADLTPCPTPALLVEEAVGTLEWLLNQHQNTSFQAEMKICYDVANGLLALHACRLMHGDIKPANVLVFPLPVIREGVEHWRFKCKISDFSLAQMVSTEDCWFGGGTPLYVAPEEGRLSPEQLLLTDVWSLGVLFAQVTQRGLDLKQALGKPELMESMIRQSVRDSIQSSTWDPPMATLRSSIFNDTVRQDPKERHLDRVVRNLETYFDSEARYVRPSSATTYIAPFWPVKHDSLYVSYENFKYVSGAVHDAVVGSLREVSEDENDTRRAQASFELSVIALSNYAGPLFTPQEGLDWLRESASFGDIRAQGTFFRAQKAFEPHAEASAQVIAWMEHAAALGHVIAKEDLCALNGSNPVKPLASPAVVAVIEEPLAEYLDATDEDGNTALILASMRGEYGAVVRLLDHGANPTATNDVGENFLHSAWCFSKAELLEIVSKVRRYLQLWSQEAKGHKMDSSRELYPRPPGTPLERAVVMNSPSAVQVLLEEGKNAFLVNGREMRRALLLAFRLHLVTIQHMLIRFTEAQKTSWDVTLPPLHQTRWEYKSNRLSFLDAVLVGGVSGFGVGADVPLKWWRICQLGEHHSAALNESIGLALSLEENDVRREALLDASKTLVFKERFHDSVQALLEWKAHVTGGSAQRAQSLKHFIWEPVEAPTTRPRQIYRLILYLLGFFHFRGGNWRRLARSFYRYHFPKTDIFMKIVRPDVNDQNLLEPWETVQLESKDETLERPVETINYVDQIFYDNDDGSLLHQTVRSGDRATFDVLVRSFGANLTLPAPRQRNIYTLLVQTPHCDLWFAKQFQALNIPFSLPLDVTPWTDKDYLPPLCEALLHSRWTYALWLLRHGASLEQQTRPGWDVLSMCFNMQAFNQGLLEFFFPHHGHGRGSDYLPNNLKGGDGFDVFKFFYECQQVRAKSWWIQRLGNIIWPASDYRNDSPLVNYRYYWDEWSIETPAAHQQEASITPKLEQCWMYLFHLYPQVPNSPTQFATLRISVPFLMLAPCSALRVRLRWLPVNIHYPIKPRSIFDQSLRMGDRNFTLFRLALAHFEERAKLRPDTDAFPTQTWLDWLYGSPLDTMSLRSWRRNPLSTKYGYWISFGHWLPHAWLHTAIFIFLVFGLMFCLQVFIEYAIPAISVNTNPDSPQGVLAMVIVWITLLLFLQVLGFVFLGMLFWDSLSLLTFVGPCCQAASMAANGNEKQQQQLLPVAASR